MAAAAAVIVLAVGAVIAFVLTRGGTDPSAGGSSTPTTAPPISTSPDFPSDSAGASVGLTTGGPNAAKVDRTHFASFSTLLGAKDADTTGAFDGGRCTLTTPGSADAGYGIADEVNCTYPGTDEVASVLRFESSAKATAYLDTLLTTLDYHAAPWATGGKARGLAYISPKNGTGIADITTSLCALPTYLVQIAAPDRTAINTRRLHDDIWNKAIFPDLVPPECNDDATGPATGAIASTGATAEKTTLSTTGPVRTRLLTGGKSGFAVVSATTSNGEDAMVLAQNGKVSFWTVRDGALGQDGTSTYPYEPSSLGPPNATAEATVLNNMTDATFIVRGTFSGDGSGNAVAFTNGPAGWGAIKAQPNGNLAPSGQGVGIGAIGLSDDFGFTDGRLTTIDCDLKLPIAECAGNKRIIKYWNWAKNQFTQAG